jgi:phosphopantetheinyl transferase
MDNVYFYFTDLTLISDKEYLIKKIDSFSNKNIINSILQYKNLNDKFLSLISKLLLKKILTDLNKIHLLSSYHLNSYKKPVIEGGFISFSHSEKCSGTAFCENGLVGIDIQYKDFSNIKEPLNYLIKHYGFNVNRKNFYNYWCRLESLLKAYGTGFLGEIENIVIENTYGIINNERFYFTEYEFKSEYLFVIASKKRFIFSKQINMKEFV